MVTHHHGLVAASPRSVSSQSPEETVRELERLRRELLRRIVERETRRQSVRGLLR